MRHPTITCPKCDNFHKSGGTDNIGLYYICNRCKYKWYNEEGIDVSKEHRYIKGIPDKIIQKGFLYVLSKGIYGDKYFRYIKKYKLQEVK